MWLKVLAKDTPLVLYWCYGISSSIYPTTYLWVQSSLTIYMSLNNLFYSLPASYKLIDNTVSVICYSVNFYDFGTSEVFRQWYFSIIKRLQLPKITQLSSCCRRELRSKDQPCLPSNHDMWYQSRTYVTVETGSTENHLYSMRHWNNMTEFLARGISGSMS